MDLRPISTTFSTVCGNLGGKPKVSSRAWVFLPPVPQGSGTVAQDTQDRMIDLILDGDYDRGLPGRRM